MKNKVYTTYDSRIVYSNLLYIIILLYITDWKIKYMITIYKKQLYSLFSEILCFHFSENRRFCIIKKTVHIRHTPHSKHLRSAHRFIM